MSEQASRAVVLTAAPGSGAIDDDLVGRVASLLANEPVVSTRWLAPGEAWEALIVRRAGDDCAELIAGLRTLTAGRLVDANVIADENAGRRRSLLVADMDSTIIQQECIDEMADVLGIKPRIAAITERAMRGELDFEAALTERLGLLAGLDEAALERVWRERIREMPGARTLVATMKKHAAFTALVSGGFTFFTSRVAASVGFDLNRANTLGIENGRLTGRVVGRILGRDAKRAALEEFRDKHGLRPTQTMAVGDGANDLEMIRAAGLGVAYRAKPLVAAQAHAAITHGDLTALLYLQGYRRDEFVTA